MSTEGVRTIAAECEDNNGLTKTTLEHLRNELGYKKLGRYVIAEIAAALEEAGLGYFPRAHLDADLNTEPRYWQEVWVYKRDGGPRARVIDAILDPDEADVPVVLDIIESSGAGLTAEQRLSRVRDIVNTPAGAAGQHLI